MSDAGVERAKALAAFCEAARPAALRLARLVSLAVRVEPALVRRARLALAPELDAGAESDFWFSPLVGSRSSEAVVLDRDVARLLRRELAARPDELERARAVVAAAHVGEPAAIRLEEEIIHLSLRGGGEAEIEERLRPALRALLAGSEGALQVSRWADRAVAGLPPEARASEPVRLLALGAAARLSPHAQASRELGRIGFPGDGSWVLPSPSSSPSASGETRIAIRLRPGALEFAEASGDAPAITLPTGSPPLVEVAWEEDGDARSVVAGIRSVVALPAGLAEVRVRTADGAEYRVTPAPAIEPTSDVEPETQAETDEILIYLSYAVRDGGPEVEALARDLASEVSRRLERPVRCVGVASRNLELEQHVREDLARDLFRCHAFVALVTDTYLNSEWCGRELAGFRARRERAGAASARLLVPVLWRGRIHFPIPPVLAELQWLKFPEYRDNGGLHGMIERVQEARQSRDHYREVIDRVATPLAGALSEVCLLPVAEPPALADLPNVFAEEQAPEQQTPEAEPQIQSQSSEVAESQSIEWVLEVLDALGFAFSEGAVDGLTRSYDEKELTSFYRIKRTDELKEYHHIREAIGYLFAGTVRDFLDSDQDEVGQSAALKMSAERAVQSALSDSKPHQLVRLLQLLQTTATPIQLEDVELLIRRTLDTAIAQLKAIPESEVVDSVPVTRELLSILRNPTTASLLARCLTPSRFRSVIPAFVRKRLGDLSFPDYLEWLTSVWADYSHRAYVIRGEVVVDVAHRFSKEAVKELWEFLGDRSLVDVEPDGSGSLAPMSLSSYGMAVMRLGQHLASHLRQIQAMRDASARARRHARDVRRKT